MFNQRSAFDEALSHPLVPAAASSDEEEQSTSESSEGRDERKKKKKKKGKIGTSGRGVTPGAVSTEGHFPTFGGPPSSSGGSGGVGTDSYAPPSAVSSVVSEEDNDNSDDGALGTVTTTTTTTLALEQESLDEALLRERSTALAEVARNMGLVHTIQRELSRLVEGQQEDIDDVEANAAEVRASTERGVEQLERARGDMRDGCGAKWRGAILTSVGATSVVAAGVFWLLAN
eukprot:CAMPEP_0197438014 /NCGR_PEP_ID=MMETSP1175-20131217/5122_1 /TAXON_ID=1003142 /ORGANISM="Triceratium dubium, Strain CCMP147" /LENGTH=230 /DNA_ID=CAMNT_0042967665 /DNA_START=385 /DNA_END=1077 /DNA_ORIENTATION=+